MVLHFLQNSLPPRFVASVPAKFVLPSNPRFNPVANLMNNCPHNPENSVRICYESKIQILYHIDWLFSKLPRNFQASWHSKDEFKDALFHEPDFYVGSSTCHMRAHLQRNPHPDSVAKIIVDQLLDVDDNALSIRILFRKLPPHFTTYLMTPKGIRGFCQFYPSLFEFPDYGEVVSLSTTPLFKSSRSLNLPFQPDSKLENGEDRSIVSAVKHLMTHCHVDTKNSTVMVVASLDKPYFNLEWVYDKLPKELKNKFVNWKHLKAYLFKYGNTFILLSKFVQLRSTLVDFPCEKSVSLEILKIQHEYKDATTEDIFRRLPPYYQSRIKTVAELRKFFALYPEFHPNNQESSASSSQESTPVPSASTETEMNKSTPVRSASTEKEMNALPVEYNFHMTESMAQPNLVEMSRKVQELQNDLQMMDKAPLALKRNIDSLADQFKMMSVLSSNSTSSNSLQDPAILSYVKKPQAEFIDMAPVDCPEDLDCVIDI